jgi:hypothetical protein
MTTSRLASLRLVRAASLVLAGAVILAACSADSPPATPSLAASSSSAEPSTTPPPTPTPTPTPAPTPRFTNEPDEELAALIPTTAAGATVVVAPFDEFALTPGDVALAYVGQPRTSLYAMRVDGDPVATEDLEPYLATAGRYVGIAGLDPDPWELSEAGGHTVWVRPEDNATAAGTMIYTWSSGEFVFLLIGVDDTVNRAIIEQLPGEPAPSATPVPAASGTAEPSESPEG